MTSPGIAVYRGGTWTSRIDAIGRLIGWLRPTTTGRSRALARLEQLRTAVADGKGFSTTLWQLSRDLDDVYPSGAIVTLARRRVRDLLLAIDRQR
jgi:hypothetical protein